MESPHLLNLPQEVRNEIYRHLIEAPTGFSRLGTYHDAQARVRWFFLTPQEVACLQTYLILIATCRQLRNEAIQMLFELNGFKNFATLGIRQLPGLFIGFIRSLKRKGFQNDESGYMWLNECDAVVRVRKEVLGDRIVAVTESMSPCLRGCGAHGVLSHWDIATAELILADPRIGIRNGILIKITWEDMIVDLEASSSSDPVDPRQDRQLASRTAGKGTGSSRFQK